MCVDVETTASGRKLRRSRQISSGRVKDRSTTSHELPSAPLALRFRHECSVFRIQTRRSLLLLLLLLLLLRRRLAILLLSIVLVWLTVLRLPILLLVLPVLIRRGRTLHTNTNVSGLIPHRPHSCVATQEQQHVSFVIA
jgi:hypothetical protein